MERELSAQARATVLWQRGVYLSAEAELQKHSARPGRSRHAGWRWSPAHPDLDHSAAGDSNRDNRCLAALFQHVERTAYGESLSRHPAGFADGGFHCHIHPHDWVYSRIATNCHIIFSRRAHHRTPALPTVLYAGYGDHRTGEMILP